MVSGLAVLLMSCALAVWVNDHTPWGGAELEEKSF